MHGTVKHSEKEWSYWATTFREAHDNRLAFRAATTFARTATSDIGLVKLNVAFEHVQMIGPRHELPNLLSHAPSDLD
jgi:hypothetical protein